MITMSNHHGFGSKITVRASLTTSAVKILDHMEV